MNRIEKVSIAGIAFTLDADAFALLKDYLDKIGAAYRKDPDGAEITADIEARIAEIILSQQEPGQIVLLQVMETVIGQMGWPEEPENSATPAETFPRRLYRNPEGAKLGGVCSGLGTFFGVDPVWIRVGMFTPLILLPFTGAANMDGLSAFLGLCLAVIFMLYPLMWFAIPAARSPRQRLEMRGERITADSIRDDMRKDLADRSAPRRARQSASVWSELLYVLGRIILISIKAVAAIVAVTLLLACIALLGVMEMALVQPEKFMVFDGGVPLVDVIGGLQGISPEAYIIILAVVALIPILVLFLLLWRLIFEGGPGARTFSILGGIWIIVTIYFVIITLKNNDTLREIHKQEEARREQVASHDDDCDERGCDDDCDVAEAAPDALPIIFTDTLTVKRK